MAVSWRTAASLGAASARRRRGSGDACLAAVEANYRGVVVMREVVEGGGGSGGVVEVVVEDEQVRWRRGGALLRERDKEAGRAGEHEVHIIGREGEVSQARRGRVRHHQLVGRERVHLRGAHQPATGAQNSRPSSTCTWSSECR